VSLKRYKDLQDAADPGRSKKSSAACAKVRECLEDVMFQYVYPRIDTEVSKHRNHLLKSPFVIHPATGKVCVPVDPKTIIDFDPDTVPTVGQLLRELERAARDSAASSGNNAPLEPGREWAATSLKPYVEAFEQHVKAIMSDVLARKKSEAFFATFSWALGLTFLYRKRGAHVYADLDRDVLISLEKRDGAGCCTVNGDRAEERLGKNVDQTPRESVKVHSQVSMR
jgi:hypothetical protein